MKEGMLAEERREMLPNCGNWGSIAWGERVGWDLEMHLEGEERGRVLWSLEWKRGK